MYIKYCLCETTGQIKWHQVADVTNSRSIFVIHSNFFLYINAITEVIQLHIVHYTTSTSWMVIKPLSPISLFNGINSGSIFSLSSTDSIIIG